MSLNFNFASNEETFQQAADATAKPAAKNYLKIKDDPRFFKPTVKNDKAEYMAQVRILPRDPEGKNLYYVPYFMHYVKEFVNGQAIYYTVKCRKMLGDTEFCPICDANIKMNKTGNDELKQKARAWSANRNYISNVLVLDDKQNVANNGKVMLWSHTKPVHEKIMAPQTTGVQLVQAEYGQEAVKVKFNPTHPVEGHNFIVHMNINPENNIPTYGNSFFEKNASQICQTQEQYDLIMSQINDLNEFIGDIPTVDEMTQGLQNFHARVAEAQAGAQMGAPAQGGFNGQTPTGFGQVPAQGGFQQAPQSAPVNQGFQQAPVQQPSMEAASAPTSVPGFDGSNFQQQPSIGDSGAYFGGVTPTAGIENAPNINAGAAPDQGAGSGEMDLPF